MLWLTPFIVVLVILAVVAILIFALWSRIRGVFGQLFNGKSLQQVIDERNEIDENVPKTIFSAESLYLPMISKDFPAFNWSEYRLKAQNVIRGVLLAQSKQDLSLIPPEAGEDLRAQVVQTIADDKEGGVRTYYDDITVHTTYITDYRKRDGRCVITTKSAVGLRKWKEKDGKLLAGDRDHRTQTRFSLELIYIQDFAQMESGTGKTLTCASCGAPIRSLGQKFCEYCGAAVEEYNIKVWSFGTLAEL